MEGIQDPVLGTQLEYLIGICFKEKDSIRTTYKSWWAHNALEEKKAFEGWVDWVEKRLEKYKALLKFRNIPYEADLFTWHNSDIL